MSEIENRCRYKHSASQARCSLPDQHDGDHVAVRTERYQWPRTPDHVCGLSGYRPYPPYNDPPCPGCVYWEEKRAAGR